MTDIETPRGRRRRLFDETALAPEPIVATPAPLDAVVAMPSPVDAVVATPALEPRIVEASAVLRPVRRDPVLDARAAPPSAPADAIAKLEDEVRRLTLENRKLRDMLRDPRLRP